MIFLILNMIIFFDYALHNTTIAITCCDGLSSSFVKPCFVLKTIEYDCPHHHIIRIMRFLVNVMVT